MVARILILIAVSVGLAAAMPVDSHDPPVTTPVLWDNNLHAAYSIYGLKVSLPYLPMIEEAVNDASKIIDGEVWQSADANGVISVKTITHPTFIGKILTKDMVQTWIAGDNARGWTEANGECTQDSSNTQLIIQGDILVKTGVQGSRVTVRTFKPVTDPDVKPFVQPNGMITLDEWHGTLPNGEGTVVYYVAPAIFKPVMSHYSLKGKPPVWVQYNFIASGPQPASVFDPSPVCATAGMH